MGFREGQRSPWENGYIESFNGKLQDELLKLDIFDTLKAARVLIERGGISTTLCGRTARLDLGLPRRKPSLLGSAPLHSADPSKQLRSAINSRRNCY